jgi:peptide/nickel transport system ATP-binding protein
MTPSPFLSVRHLTVEFPTRRGTLRAIDDISFDLAPGEVLGIVGESGAGKSLTAAALIRLLEPPGRIAGGEVHLKGTRIDNLAPEALRKVRGKRIGMVFQDPLTSLNPLYTIGEQLIETIRTHADVSEAQARARAIALLDEVGIPAAAKRIGAYPQEFSGGMRQRVVIALAMAAGPELVIADEPTTALDVSVQAQIIALLKRTCREHGAAVILITHDMGVIAETADRVAVMYAGRIVEIGPVRDVIQAPKHPYTKGLMGSIPTLEDGQSRLAQIPGSMPRLNQIPKGCSFNPRCEAVHDRCRIERPERRAAGPSEVACFLYDGTSPIAQVMPTSTSAPPSTTLAARPPHKTMTADATPLIEVTGLARTFDVSKPWLNRVIERDVKQYLKAVDGVTLSIRRGETFALVGESGSGKSTVAKMVVGLVPPTAGRILFDGEDIGLPAGAAALQRMRKRIAMIFQDPYASLNPRMRAAQIIAEPIRAFDPGKDANAVTQRIHELLRLVKLDPADGEKYPHEFSGGQRQRIAIARALAGSPEFIVCDEPTSALDVSVQAQILNLMRDLQDDLGLTYLLISHNLAVVKRMAARVGVMYLGRVVEVAGTKELFSQPRHPYTRMLLDAVPDLAMSGRPRTPVQGEVPNPINPPTGCTFHPRCPLANARCKAERPAPRNAGGATVACHAVEEGRL